jgi:hypothetical protein
LDSILLETDIFCDPELQTNYVHVSCHECGSILQAERAQLKRKLDKIKKFINCHSETKDLQRNLDQLVAFASSSKGLVEDSYREKVWPILARNMPFSQRYIRRFIDDDFIDINEIDEDKDSVHDSDFESALSSISSKDAEEIEMKDPENSDGSSCHVQNKRNLFMSSLFRHQCVG